jgi:hypothetical protein
MLAAVALDDPAGHRLTSTLSCERVAASRSRGICLQAARGVFTTYRGVLFAGALTPSAIVPLAGVPSRTRVSRDGRLGATTAFVSGHAYTASFSTETTLIDMETGDPIGNLEEFNTWRDGVRVREEDFNFWGVTFTSDSNVFYATLSTADTSYLVRGDVALRRLTVLRAGVECPSVSPDDRLIAYKRRAGPGSGEWRLHVLDLSTMMDAAVAGERRSIDDQVEWLDSRHVLYAVPRTGSATGDVWVAPVDGSAPPRIFIEHAESPAVVR